ncbi:MAG: YihY/virulence factor BrkB family protein [Bacteroidales bacterium]|jgi:membrane protein|nr:YihY/virulence factor BrkB family protein [Bacteroidales bacterium]
MKQIDKLKNWLVRKAKKVSFPGFNKYPIYEILKFFFRGIQKGQVGQRAASVTYSTFLALFPAIIFLFALLPYIPIDNFQVKLLALIQNFLPHNAYLSIEDTIKDIVTKQRGSLLSLTFFFAVFIASNGVISLIRAFNSSYHSIEYRKWWTRRLISILLVFIQFLLITIAIALLTITETLYNRYFDDFRVLWYVFVFLRIVIILALFFFSVSFVYYMAPARRGRFRFFTPGASLATFLIVIASYGFSSFVNNFGQYNKLYGSIGTIMVVLIFIYIMSFAMIIGFELNASIIERGRIKQNDES